MKIKWNKIKFREPTEEEKRMGLTDLIFDCEMPDDGENILITLNGKVYADTAGIDVDYSSGYNLYYLEGGYDLACCTAWAPLPEPYRAESEG